MAVTNSVLISLIAVPCVGYLWFKGIIPVILFFGSYLYVGLIGMFIGFYYVFSQGPYYKPNSVFKESGLFLKMLSERNRTKKSPVQKQSTVITRNIDSILNEVLDFIIRDYFVFFLKDLVYDCNKLEEMIKEDAWTVIKNIRDVFGKIDEVKFITHDVTNKVYQHYLKIRVSSLGEGKEPKPLFLLRPYLQSAETEMDFLRKVSESLLVLLLPPQYKSCKPVQHLLREILACAVLYPTIKLLCNPDYINEKILSYVQYHQEVLDHHKKTYSYAATYEDFIKMITESTDVEHLKRMRYKIMSEIMQATTINNLKKAKGIDVDKEFNPQGGHKGDLLQARNLRRYINQLKCAKIQCEKKIKYLGGPDYLSPSSPTSLLYEQLSPHIPGKKVLSFQVIMENPYTRQNFTKFLEKNNSQAFLGFWETVEDMKQTDKKYLHNIGNEAYNTYLAAINNTLKLEKSIIKRMEEFLIGNKGPEAFFEAQDIIAHHLEERHYPCFIVSDVYHKMLRGAENKGIDFMTASTDQSDESECGLELSVDSFTNPNICLSDHSSFAKDKLEQLSEKLSTKLQALHAIRGSHNADMKMVAKLEKEVESMRTERNQLEYHIERTEVWSENLGSWRIQIQSCELITKKDRVCPTFSLIVHLKGDENDVKDSCIADWIVAKELNDFLDLHRKLIQIGPWLKNSELPREGKTLFKHYDKPYMEKARALIQSYMDLIMEDDKLNKSEVLYTFLSPTPELLKQPNPSPKKNKFFLANLFKGNQNVQLDSNEDDEFLFLDDETGSLKDDPIAEPLYALIGEVFDMRGVFKLLRRTLISFVQITYGRTINRQLRDTVSWLFSESMIVYYIHLFRDSMWPNGILAKPVPQRSQKQKMHAQYQARQQFVANIPDVLSNLVGQQNARKGALKVFESLQDERLNKQLLYELIELLLFEMLTESKPKSN